MAGRGPQTFKKRQKEQERKERQAEKLARREQRKADKAAGGTGDGTDELDFDARAAEAERARLFDELSRF